MNSDILLNRIYMHYKGGLYQTLYIAKHSETEEDMVVYKPLYEGAAVWVRPLKMWNEDVTVGNRQVKRFELTDREV